MDKISTKSSGKMSSSNWNFCIAKSIFLDVLREKGQPHLELP